MRNLFKNIIKIGAVGAFFFTTAPVVSILLLGYLAVKGVDLGVDLYESIKRKRMSAALNIDDDSLRRNEKMHKENTMKKFFDSRHEQWNVDALPFDMYPNLGIKDREAYFTCAGVENIVLGRYLGKDLFGRQKVEFSMVINDSRRAELMSEYIAENGIIGTSVTRMSGGNFLLKSDNAVDINTLVKEFYPPRTMEVEREIRTTRQYKVSGCSSYEEAVEKLQAERGMHPVMNTFITYCDTVDGVKDHPYGESGELVIDSLQPGEFIVNETTWEVYSRNITFNGAVDCTDEALRSEASEGFVCSYDDRVEDKCSNTPQYSNALEDKEVTRVLYPDNQYVQIRNLDSNKEEVVHYSSSRVVLLNEQERAAELSRASLVLRFSSLQELDAFMADPFSIQDKTVLLDRNSSPAKDGEFVLSVPLNDELISSMSLNSGLPEALSEKYRYAGLDFNDIQVSCILNELTRRDYATVTMNEVPDFSNARINGVSLKEFDQRRGYMVEKGLTEGFESDLHAAMWLKGVYRINSVRMDLDMKNSRMVLTSNVTNSNGSKVTMVEQKELDENQLRHLASRGKVPQYELKELLMMMHPDFFASYNGRGYNHPLDDFINGHKPQRTESAAVETKMKVEKKVEKEEKKTKKTLLQM